MDHWILEERDADGVRWMGPEGGPTVARIENALRYATLGAAIDAKAKRKCRETFYPIRCAADAPAVGAPAKCGAQRAAARALTWHVCELAPGHSGNHIANKGTLEQYEWIPSCEIGTRAQVDNRVGGDVPADKLVEENRRLSNRNHELLAERGELSAKLSRVMQEKTLQGDILGANAALRLDVARLEGDVSYWQREAVRLGGKARVR